MNAMPPVNPERGRGAVAWALCGLLGIVIGMTGGVNIARRLVPPATEARLVMQLLELEQVALDRDAMAGNCSPLPSERMQLLTALIELIPLSMRDTLVVDADFEREVQRLRAAAQTLAQPGNSCGHRRNALKAIDAACSECHEAYRTGG